MIAIRPSKTMKTPEAEKWIALVVSCRASWSGVGGGGRGCGGFGVSDGGPVGKIGISIPANPAKKLRMLSRFFSVIL
jgi:hypothetical protein